MKKTHFRKYLADHPGLLRAAVLAKRCLLRGYMLFCSVLPLRKQALFVSYYGKGYGDNSKAIAEEMHRSCPEYSLLYAVKPGFEATLPPYVKPVRYGTLAFYRELAVSKIWVDNSRKNSAVRKRKRQFYVQTWHGGIGFKKVEADEENNLGRGYIEDAKHDAAMADLMPVGSSFFSGVIERAFWYRGEILHCGTPRLDLLFAAEKEERRAKESGEDSAVRKKLGLAPGTRAVLYAPTFRSDGATSAYEMDFTGLLRTLEEKTGDSWTVLLRFHPNVSALSCSFAKRYGLTDVTDYPDLYELIPVADLVISDFSSLIFDAGCIAKPVLLYAKDRSSYDRDFYLQPEKIPFGLAENDEELQKLVREFDIPAYRRNLRSFYEAQGSREDGHASERLVKRMTERLEQG